MDTPEDPKEVLDKFLKGEADIVILNNKGVEGAVQQFGLKEDDIVAVMPLFKTVPYMALSLSTSDETLYKIQRAYNQLLNDNKLNLLE